jgi:dihydroorotate dehydrogenase electron transfer subunit
MYPGINPLPGQFFQLRVHDGLDPFLNRPISIASYSHNKVLLIVKVVGKGTEMLSRKNEGDSLVMLGPFGKGIKPKKKKSLVIAGGIGVAPLYFLAEYLKKMRVTFTFLYGTKTTEDFILKRNIIMLAKESIFVTEQGFKKKQTVVSALQEIDLRDYEVAYACGPKEMFIELQKLNLSLPIYAFCEDFLGCGCGLCLGCAIKYQGVYKRVCEDGPVFELKGINFERSSLG